MGEKKNGKKVVASDVAPGSRLEAMLLSLGETVKESAARSARAEELAAEAIERAARADERAAEVLQALLKFVQRTETRLETIEAKQ